jgi:hypothetical protein
LAPVWQHQWERQHNPAGLGEYEPSALSYPERQCRSSPRMAPRENPMPNQAHQCNDCREPMELGFVLERVAGGECTTDVSINRMTS